MTRWLNDWWVTLRYGSRLTRAGRELRRNVRLPLADYVEVERPINVATLTDEERGILSYIEGDDDLRQKFGG